MLADCLAHSLADMKADLLVELKVLNLAAKKADCLAGH